MGADLYLHTVLQECYKRYGWASRLVHEARDLAAGDVERALHTESYRLKEALLCHANQTGEMRPDLFDLVAEIADLSQGEWSVWTAMLAHRLTEHIQHMEQSAGNTCNIDERGKAEREEDTSVLGQTSQACLADDLVDLFKGHLDAPIRHGLTLLSRRLETIANTREEKGTLTRALAALSKSMEEVLEGNPTSALALLIEQRVIPSLEQSCADQKQCLEDLTRALEPISSLVSSLSPPTSTTIFSAGQTLVAFRELTSHVYEVTDVLRRGLGALLHASSSSSSPASSFPWKEVVQYLLGARAELQAFCDEGEKLEPALEEATETLGTLLIRTLPHSELLEQGVQGTHAEDIPLSPSALSAPPSPLRQAFGTMLRQQAVCNGTVQLVEQSMSAVERILSGEAIVALSEVCSTMMRILYADYETEHPAHAEPSLAEHVTLNVSQTVPLVSGIALFPGTLMDMHYVQVMASVHQVRQQHQMHKWVHSALEERPEAQGLAGITRIILRFWHMLQGNPLPWGQILAELLGDVLAQESSSTTQQEHALTLVTHLRDLLRGDPASLLQAKLASLSNVILPFSPPSPLIAPVEALSQLARGEIDAHLKEALSTLDHEVQQRVDWPEERTRDIRFLLDLGSALLHASQEQQGQVLVTTLIHVWCKEDSKEQLEASLRASLSQAISQALTHAEHGTHLLRELQALLDTLPEPNLQAPRADPRLAPFWRLYLLRELIAILESPESLERLDEGEREVQATQEPRTSKKSGKQPIAFPLVEHVLWTMQQIMRAWLFPEQGYFRDPYNDTSLLWIATGAFWPAIAENIVEPIGERDRDKASWQIAEREEISLHIPLSRVQALLHLVKISSLRLPEHHHLARWGTNTICLEEQGPYCLEAWHAYFAQRRQAFIAFLEEALAREEPILCSL